MEQRSIVGPKYGARDQAAQFDYPLWTVLRTSRDSDFQTLIGMSSGTRIPHEDLKQFRV
jgi:hypothetical protein